MIVAQHATQGLQLERPEYTRFNSTGAHTRIGQSLVFRLGTCPKTLLSSGPWVSVLEKDLLRLFNIGKGAAKEAASVLLVDIDCWLSGLFLGPAHGDFRSRN